MRSDEVKDQYFEWIFERMCDGRFAPEISFRRLFEHLHKTRFRYTIPRDRNRADDGEDLRYKFALTCAEDPCEIDDIVDILDRPCTVLEMMVALAIRAEETIMDDPGLGDRTAQWFWTMLCNLGLGAQHDEYFDRDFVIDTLERFMDHEYEPNGKGGLFVIRNCDRDLRSVEIWYQLCWYLDNQA